MSVLVKIKQKLEEELDDILENSPQLSQVSEIKNAVDLYRKSQDGKDNPEKITGMITKHVRDKFIEKFMDEFSDRFLSTFSEQTGISVDATQLQNKQVSLSVPSMIPHVDLIMSVGGKETSLFKIGFKIANSVTLQGVEIEKSVMRVAKIETMDVTITVYIQSSMIIRMKPIKLGEKSFQMKNITLPIGR